MLEYNIYGNKQVWHKLVNDCLTGKLAHTYLFSGPMGIGKTYFAKNFIKYILKADQSLSSRIDQNNYLDLKIINKQDKTEISVDSIRKSIDFLTQTPHEGDKKFLIIDSTDDLNKNSANALLKALEEPRPNNYIFLISHNLYNIIPTIKSRARIIKFFPLSKDDLKLLVTNERSLNFFEDYIAGSAVKAIEAGSKVVEDLYLKVIEFLETGNILIFNKFIDGSLKNSWEKISDLTTYLICKCIKIKSSCAKNLDPLENDILLKISENKSLDDWFEILEAWQKALKEQEVYNLDKRQILLLTLENMRNKEIIL